MMNSIPFKNWFRRSMTIMVALLISNAAAVTCALAVDICSDCPEEPPSHCIEMFDDSEMASVDKTTNKEPPTTHSDDDPFYTTALLFPPHKTPAKESASQWPPDTIYSSPPINLLNCVFLK